MVEERPGARRERQPGVDAPEPPTARDSRSRARWVLTFLTTPGGASSLGEHGQEPVVTLGEQSTDDLGLGGLPLPLVLALDAFEQIVHQAERQLRGGQGDQPRVALVDLVS